MRSIFLGKPYKDGELICRQGELGDCMYVIQEGHVMITVRRGEKEFCIGELQAGDFFGESAIFEQEARPYTVRAMDETSVLTVEKRMFLARLNEDPSFVVKVIKKMSKRIRNLEDDLVRTADSVALPVAPK
jgi:CRP-like cAMP-binding protein